MTIRKPRDAGHVAEMAARRKRQRASVPGFLFMAPAANYPDDPCKTRTFYPQRPFDEVTRYAPHQGKRECARRLAKMGA